MVATPGTRFQPSGTHSVNPSASLTSCHPAGTVPSEPPPRGEPAGLGVLPVPPSGPPPPVVAFVVGAAAVSWTVGPAPPSAPAARSSPPNRGTPYPRPPPTTAATASATSAVRRREPPLVRPPPTRRCPAGTVSGPCGVAARPGPYDGWATCWYCSGDGMRCVPGRGGAYPPGAAPGAARPPVPDPPAAISSTACALLGPRPRLRLLREQG